MEQIGLLSVVTLEEPKNAEREFTNIKFHNKLHTNVPHAPRRDQGVELWSFYTEYVRLGRSAKSAVGGRSKLLMGDTTRESGIDAVFEAGYEFSPKIRDQRYGKELVIFGGFLIFGGFFVAGVLDSAARFFADYFASFECRQVVGLKLVAWAVDSS